MGLVVYLGRPVEYGTGTRETSKTISAGCAKTSGAFCMQVARFARAPESFKGKKVKKNFPDNKPPTRLSEFPAEKNKVGA